MTLIEWILVISTYKTHPQEVFYSIEVCIAPPRRGRTY